MNAKPARIVWGAGEGHTREHAYATYPDISLPPGRRHRSMCGTTRSAHVAPRPGDKKLPRCLNCAYIAEQWIARGHATEAGR